MNRADIVGRIAGTPIYTPAIIGRDGKTINAKCELTVIENDRDKKNYFRVTGWGGQADNMARGGAVGKAITVFGKLSTYKGRVWMDFGANGVVNMQPVQSPQGGDYLTTKTGITLERLDWGADSGKNIAQEIQDYQNNNGSMGRPPMWQAPGHADNEIWKNICAARKATQYTPGDARFGYAEVRIPNGAQLAPPKQNGGGNQYVDNNANNGGHQGGFQGNNGANNGQQPNNNGYPQQGGYQANPPQNNSGDNRGFQGATTNNNGQVNFNGQNMGQSYNTGTSQVANGNQGNPPQGGNGQGNTQYSNVQM